MRTFIAMTFTQIYYAGINKKAVLNELIATLNATDKDLGANSTIEMIIAASYLFKFGHSQATIGSIVPSPFGMKFAYKKYVLNCN